MHDLRGSMNTQRSPFRDDASEQMDPARYLELQSEDASQPCASLLEASAAYLCVDCVV